MKMLGPHTILISHPRGNVRRVPLLRPVIGYPVPLMWPENIICGRKNGGNERISRNFREFRAVRQSYGRGFIAVERLTNSRLVMVTVVYRAGNTRNTVAIMNENLMIHYAHRVFCKY